MKDTYIQLAVPLHYDAKWFRNLRDSLPRFKFKESDYHSTLAFLDNTPETVDMPSLLDEFLDSNSYIPELTFDKVDVFKTKSGKEYIIHLTSSHISEEFTQWVNDLRDVLKNHGCTIQSDFLLHVTLRRIKVSRADFKELQTITNNATVPPFTLTLRDISHILLEGHQELYQKSMKQR